MESFQSKPAATTHSLQKSVVLKGHIDAAQFCRQEAIVAVATSYLTGERWNGGITIISHDLKISAEVATRAGNTSVCWVGTNEDLVASGSDNAAIYLWSFREKGKELVLSFAEHDDIVSSVATHPTQKDVFISASWDSSLKIWEIDSENSLSTFEGGHNGMIYSVDWSHHHADLFFSAGSDGLLLGWDRRLGSGSSAAKAIASRFQYPTALWSCSSACFAAVAQKVSVGAADGTVLVFDSRNMAAPLFKDTSRTAAVHNVTFSHLSDYLAVACDDGSISVFDSQMQKVYSSQAHNDNVRALAWAAKNRGQLLSGGFEKTLVLHEKVIQ